MSCGQGLWSLLLTKIIDPQDSLGIIHKKKVTLVVSLCLIFLGLVCSVFIPDLQWNTVAIILALLIGMVNVIWLLTKKSIPNWFLTIFFITLVVIVAILDYHGASQQKLRCWPAFLCVLNLGLALSISARLELAVLSMILVWFLVIFIEDTSRFGLYDIPLTASQASRREFCDCSLMPCKRSFAPELVNLLMMATILLVDYYTTVRFLRKLRTEQQKTKASVDTACRISSCLSVLDLDEAESSLKHSSELLPLELHEAFIEILDILKQSLQYLPTTCVPGKTDIVREQAADRMSTASSNLSASVLSSDSLTPRSSLKSKRAIALRRELSAGVVSLVSTHIRNFDIKSDFFSCDVLSDVGKLASDIATEFGGVLDYFGGDLLRASFNASHKCASHRVHAAKTAAKIHLQIDQRFSREITQMTATGVSSGDIVHGDLSTGTRLWYCLMGAVLSRVETYRELARSESITQVIVDSAICNDAKVFFDMRLLPRQVNLFGSNEYLWELDYSPQIKTRELDDSEEWMYQLGEFSKYVAYNQACAQYLSGDADIAIELLSPLISHEAELISKIRNCSIPRPIILFPLDEGGSNPANDSLQLLDIISLSRDYD